MDDLDLTEQVPRDFETGPVPQLDVAVDDAWTPALIEPVAPLAADRAALGTKTGIAALPRRTITMPPPIPTAARRARGTEPGGIDVDFTEEAATTLREPHAATDSAAKDEPAWLAKFHPPKLEDAAFLYDKPAKETTVHVDGSLPSTTSTSSAAADFWTAAPRATDAVAASTTKDEPPPWESDRAPSEPLSWTAPVIKQPAELPVSSSPIAAIVAAAEAETAAAIAATMKQFAPKPAPAPAPVAPAEVPVLASVVSPESVAAPAAPVEPVVAGSVDIGFDAEDGTTADPWAATDAASSAGLQLPRPQVRARTSTVNLPPPMPSRARTASSVSIALPAVDRTPSVLVEVDAQPAMPKLPAPSANWVARRSGQIASATEPREPTQTLPPLPAPQQGWGRAPSPSANAFAPTAMARPHSAADVTASLDDDDEILLAAARPSRASLKLGALICAGGVVMAGIVYAIVRAASPATPVPATEPVAETAPVAAPVAAPVPVAVAAPAAVAAPVAAPAPVPPPVAIAAAVPAPAPAAVAVAVPAATPEPLPSVIAMPITTNPPGATVTLVANGTATVLGATPVTASLDPSKGYDLVIAYRGQPTRMQHVAPGTREVRIDLDAAAPAATHAIAAAPPVAETRAEHHAAPAPEHHAAPAPEHHAAAAPVKAPEHHTAAKPAVAVAPGPNSGVLMVSSKPPCEIWVDGKATHLMTPQRKMTLPAGPHTITLLNASQHIQSQSKIEILVGLPSRLIKDFSAH